MDRFESISCYARPNYFVDRPNLTTDHCKNIRDSLCRRSGDDYEHVITYSSMNIVFVRYFKVAANLITTFLSSFRLISETHIET